LTSRKLSSLRPTEFARSAETEHVLSENRSQFFPDPSLASRGAENKRGAAASGGEVAPARARPVQELYSPQMAATRRASMPVGIPACASATERAVMLTMPRGVTDGVNIWAGLATPIRIGPTGNASAMIFVI